MHIFLNKAVWFVAFNVLRGHWAALSQQEFRYTAPIPVVKAADCQHQAKHSPSKVETYFQQELAVHSLGG